MSWPLPEVGLDRLQHHSGGSWMELGKMRPTESRLQSSWRCLLSVTLFCLREARYPPRLNIRQAVSLTFWYEDHSTITLSYKEVSCRVNKVACCASGLTICESWCKWGQQQIAHPCFCNHSWGWFSWQTKCNISRHRRFTSISHSHCMMKYGNVGSISGWGSPSSRCKSVGSLLLPQDTFHSFHARACGLEQDRGAGIWATSCAGIQFHQKATERDCENVWRSNSFVLQGTPLKHNWAGWNVRAVMPHDMRISHS